MGIFGKSQEEKWNDASDAVCRSIYASFGSYLNNIRMFEILKTDPYVAGYLQARLTGTAMLACAHYSLPQGDLRPVLGFALQKIYLEEARAVTNATKKFTAERSPAYVTGMTDANNLIGYMNGNKNIATDRNYSKAVSQCEAMKSLYPNDFDADMGMIMALEQVTFGAYMLNIYPDLVSASLFKGGECPPEA